MKVLVTGAAGFIGFHTARRLLQAGHQVVGIDNLNDYYDPQLKRARLDVLERAAGFTFTRLDIADGPGMQRLFEQGCFERVVHLAAQAGVRYSIENPRAYVQSNVAGFLEVLEGCRHFGVGHLVYASTSSVYGANARLPFAERHGADHPLSLYAATKKANELMAHSYSSLYRLPTTGLRFFTVYGPWGRPDMALFLFTRRILAGQPIDVFHGGRHRRDFTYVDDIVDGVLGVLDHVAAPDPAWDAAAPDPSASDAPYKIYNIGNSAPVSVMRYIEVLEECLGRKAELRMLAQQPGDVLDTWADVDALARAVDYRPATRLEEGVKYFVEWYRDYYHPPS